MLFGAKRYLFSAKIYSSKNDQRQSSLYKHIFSFLRVTGNLPRHTQLDFISLSLMIFSVYHQEIFNDIRDQTNSNNLMMTLILAKWQSLSSEKNSSLI